MDDNMYRFYVNLIIIITTLVSSLIIGGSFFFYYYRRNRNTLPHGSSSSQILSNNETDITKISLNSVATNKSHKASKTVSINIGVSHSSDSSKLPDVPLAEYISETISDRKEDSVYTQNNIKKGSSNTNTKKLSPIAESYTLPKSNTESSEAGKGPNVPLNNTNTFTINSSDHSSNTRTSRPSFSSPSHTIPDTGNYLSIPGFLQIDPTSFLIGAKITSGGGGEIMKVVVVTDELRSRAPNQQLVAKVMTSGGEK